MTYNILDLFSGIGGMSLGLERAGMHTAAFCEIDPWCKQILRKHWPDTPIYDDVRTLDYDGSIDIICGGYPCQPFSVAGNRKGKEDDRHLWPAMFGLIQKHRPRWVIGENVAGHISMGLDDVLAQLEGEEYTARTFIIPACAVGAQHRRDRVWIVANANSSGIFESERRGDGKTCEDAGKIGQEVSATGQPIGTSFDGISRKGHEAMAYTKSEQSSPRDNGREQGSACQPQQSQLGRGNSGTLPRCEWAIEPAVGRVVNGVPRRMDRLRALGNAVVPQIPEMIGRAIMEIEKHGQT